MLAWTPERDEQLAELHRRGLTGAAIGEAMGGLSRNAVIARLHRLRAKGDARVGPARLNPAVEAAARRTAEMDRLADAFAAGAPTLNAAATAAGLTWDRAAALWQAIKAGLGPQAV